MNIHEYQAKELFDRFHVPSPKGKVASTPEEAIAAAKEFAGAKLVIKAQVHAGGRGKGHFKNGFQGGVHLIESPEQAGDFAGKMLNETLVTVQTGDAGRLVRKVMIAEAVDITHEFYLAILMDRDTCAPVIVASTEGGMSIEDVAPTLLAWLGLPIGADMDGAPADFLGPGPFAEVASYDGLGYLE